MKTHILAVAALTSLAGLGLMARSDPPADWPMWGGTPDRNMVSNMKGLPTDVGRQDQEEREVGRRARLADATATPSSPTAWCWSAPTTKAMRDPKQPGDRGVLMAFREADGEFLWQQTHEKLVVGPRQRLAVSGRRLVAAGRGRHRLLHVEPRRAVVRRHQRLPRRQERRPGQGREADRPDTTSTSSGRST